MLKLVNADHSVRNKNRTGCLSTKITWLSEEVLLISHIVLLPKTFK